MTLVPALLALVASQSPSVEPVAPAPESTELRSLFSEPLFLGEEPPENRALRHIVITYPGAVGARRPATTSEDEARSLAADLVARLRAGADFLELSRRYSGSPTAATGGVQGSFAPGVLPDPLDEFLFAADLWELSDPLSLPTGIHVAQRIDRLAGCRQVLVQGKSDKARGRAAELLTRLRAGADFAEVAREESDDEFSAARGGALGVFERSAFDTLIKAAVFELEVGQVSEPVQSPRGFHILKRVAPESLPPELMDPVWVRARSILVSYGAAPGMPAWVERTAPEAVALVEELHERILAGEDFAELAAEFDDDPTGRERRGDLGWLHRRSPGVEKSFAAIFLAEPGEVLPPKAVPQGWVILRREQ